MHPEDWLNEEIWHGTLNTLPRRRAIWRFAKYGLEPFLKAHGYTLNINTRELSSGIATLLYHNRGQGLIGPYEHDLNAQNEYSDEHRQHYNHVIDYATWQKFWSDWSHWDDVSPESPYGFYRRLDIEEYCWSQLNLALSAQTQVVEDCIDGYAADEVRDERDEF